MRLRKVEGGGEHYCDLNKCAGFTLGEYCEYCEYCNLKKCVGFTLGEYCKYYDLNKCVGFTPGEGERGQLTN